MIRKLLAKKKKNQPKVIPTPQEFEMKWLPKRKAREEREFNCDIDRRVQQIVGNLEQGYTRFECLAREGEERKAVEKRLNAAGWNVRWDRLWTVQLTPLSEERA
jgi:hypothetical protein